MAALNLIALNGCRAVTVTYFRIQFELDYKIQDSETVAADRKCWR